MADIIFTSIPSEHAKLYRDGALDAHNMTPEIHISDGAGLPCRHCQQDIEKNAPYLVLAYRPFQLVQPYAEVGPIFIHAISCDRYPETNKTPPMFLKREGYLLKGYNYNNRIVYGTGKIVMPMEISSYACELFEQSNIAYIHVRSSLNNCFTCRIDRAYQ
jgi:hypothetical protein